MSNEREHIDDYFADALGEREEDDLDLDLNWKAVEPGLNRYSFLRFDVHRFNIYYLTLATALMASSFFISLNRRSDGKQSITSVLQDSTRAVQPRQVMTKKEEPSVVVMQRAEEKKRSNNTIVEKDELQAPVTHTPDSITSKTVEGIKNLPVMTNEIKRTDSLTVKKVKPPVVISRKRDTIIKVDTVYVKKKKKNR